MSGLLKRLDCFTQRLGLTLGYVCLVMALLMLIIVVLRDGFNWGSIALQEAVMYLHGCLFMLGAAYALQQDAHVRVDIFYRGFSARGKAWVDALGTVLFLIPFCVLVFWGSLAYVGESWAGFESSPEPGGIPAVYLLKTLIPVFAVLLLLQGLVQGAKAVCELIKERPDA